MQDNQNEQKKPTDYKAVAAYFIGAVVVAGFGALTTTMYSPVSAEAIGADIIPIVVYVIALSLAVKGFKMMRGSK